MWAIGYNTMAMTQGVPANFDLEKEMKTAPNLFFYPKIVIYGLQLGTRQNLSKKMNHSA